MRVQTYSKCSIHDCLGYWNIFLPPSSVPPSLLSFLLSIHPSTERSGFSAPEPWAICSLDVFVHVNTPFNSRSTCSSYPNKPRPTHVPHISPPLPSILHSYRNGMLIESVILNHDIRIYIPTSLLNNLWPWTSYFTNLCLRFLPCKMGKKQYLLHGAILKIKLVQNMAHSKCYVLLWLLLL